MTIIDNRVRSMDMLNDPIPPKQLHVTGRDERSRQGFKYPCVVTQRKERHAPWSCSNFKDLSLKYKQSAIAASKSCQNCSRFNQESDKFSSKSRSKTCQGKQHTFLHEAFTATPGKHSCNLTQTSSRK